MLTILAMLLTRASLTFVKMATTNNNFTSILFFLFGSFGFVPPVTRHSESNFGWISEDKLRKVLSQFLQQVGAHRLLNTQVPRLESMNMARVYPHFLLQDVSAHRLTIGVHLMVCRRTMECNEFPTDTYAHSDKYI